MSTPLTLEYLIKYILTRQYFCRQYLVPVKKRRRKIFEELQKTHGIGHVDSFEAAWKTLENKGLIDTGRRGI